MKVNASRAHAVIRISLLPPPFFVSRVAVIFEVSNVVTSVISRLPRVPVFSSSSEQKSVVAFDLADSAIVKAGIAAGKQTEDADKIQGLLSDAAKRWKAKSYDTPERAIEAFCDALQPASAAERGWYEAALRDREWQV